jgi:16S rRNA (uracil1498-N3)-methyltransferase
MQIFYTPEINENPILPHDEARHCINVLRMKAGDRINLTDGKGNFYLAEIAAAKLSDCKLNVLEIKLQKKTWKGFVEIALAPTKNADRTEWFAEKAVELGIDRISLISSRFSERKEMKTDRIRRVMIAAMKQSLKAQLPELREMCAFRQFIAQEFDGQKFIAHCNEGEKPLLAKTYQPAGNVLLLIGPEGDFSEEEVAMAVACGFQPVSLGESRLRTETAALAALNAIHIINLLNE